MPDRTRVLVAEDDPDLLALARAALTRGGFDVVAVEDGKSALERAQREAYAVVLLDWFMPGLDGPDVCAALRAARDGPGPPVIFLTSKTDPATRRRGRDLGATGFITKPFVPLQLPRIVRAVIDGCAIVDESTGEVTA
jgi:DNA-binding response OmpR family regulator